MKIFTNRLGQFAGCAVVVTIAMNLAIHYLASHLTTWTGGIIAVLYFSTMFSLGWYFGKKDDEENNIYDIGLRWHIVTFLICNGLRYLFWCLLYGQPLVGTAYRILNNINTSVIIWSAFLVFHFMLFLLTRKNSLKGYNKEELFE